MPRDAQTTTKAIMKLIELQGYQLSAHDHQALLQHRRITLDPVLELRVQAHLTELEPSR